MHSYAEFIEMQGADIRKYAFVRRVIEIKRTSVNHADLIYVFSVIPIGSRGVFIRDGSIRKLATIKWMGQKVDG